MFYREGTKKHLNRFAHICLKNVDEIVNIYKRFEFRTVQKCVNLADLEKNAAT